MGKETRTFAVVGLGVFGSSVATDLARFGNKVIGVDLDESRVSRMASTLDSTVILDTTDDQAMREAGIDRYDVGLVAIGSNIEASILTTMNLKLLGLKTIWAKATTRTHHRILSKLGVDRIILPEQDMGHRVAQMLNNPTVQDYLALGNGYSVVHIEIPERLDGAALSTLKVGEDYDLRLLGVMRGTEFIAPERTDFTLQTEDRLIILGKRAELRRFGDAL